VPRSGRFRWRRVLLWSALGALLLFGLIQLVPYGRDHSNPPVTGEPKWDSAVTRALAARACFDCHSNETTWPWYSNVAPVSWLVQSDVDGGRETLNFSEWNRLQEAEPGEIEEVIRGGSMPPWYYTLQHSDAKLSRAEKDALIQGLDATIAASPPGG
jgi:mono/diheme cytochrome c family protein